MIPSHHRGFIHLCQCSSTGPGQYIKRMVFHKNPAVLFPVFHSLCISCLIASGIRVIISWCLFRGFFVFFFPQYLLVKSLGEKKNSDLLLDSCRSQQMSEWLVGWFILETGP